MSNSIDAGLYCGHCGQDFLNVLETTHNTNERLRYLWFAILDLLVPVIYRTADIKDRIMALERLKQIIISDRYMLYTLHYLYMQF